ncbi:MAG: hypothetical protein HZB66_03035, partial [Candidatus Aenigmarchaeota archaeon]|nr:hypothetical protein [Candidatus Aenigmarchaeota archaeon]
MATETPTMLELPGFNYDNFYTPAIALSSSLIENARSGRYAHNLAADSAPLQWRVALYHVGRGLEWSDQEAQRLHDAVKEAGKQIYENAQLCRQGKRYGEGTFHRDALLLYPKSGAPKGWRQPKGDYKFGIYLQGIEGFEKKGEEWKPVECSDTKEIKLWVAPGDGRFIVPTTDGAYHPEAGIFLATEEALKKAIGMWMETGLSEEQAKNELSKGYRKDSGLAAVESWSYGDGGSLCVDLRYGPGYRGYFGGSFPASRSPSGARHAAKSASELRELVNTYEITLSRIGEEIKNARRK